jgi:hypothetical protein
VRLNADLKMIAMRPVNKRLVEVVNHQIRNRQPVIVPHPLADFRIVEEWERRILLAGITFSRMFH